MPSYSPLAKRSRKLAGRTRRKGEVRGVILHTTGSTIVLAAKKAKRDVLEHVVEHYLTHDEGPTYVIGPSGKIVQVADEDKVTWHAGIKQEQLAAYMNGSWRNKVQAHLRWDEVWNKHGIYDPRLLVGAHRDGGFPDVNEHFLGVNEHFIGIEMPPIAPAPKGALRFTPEQHQAAAELCADILARRGLLGRAPHTVVLGHEDVNPLARFDKDGGWDPGALRLQPHFDMNLILKALGGSR